MFTVDFTISYFAPKMYFFRSRAGKVNLSKTNTILNLKTKWFHNVQMFYNIFQFISHNIAEHFVIEPNRNPDVYVEHCFLYNLCTTRWLPLTVYARTWQILPEKCKRTFSLSSPVHIIFRRVGLCSYTRSYIYAHICIIFAYIIYGRRPSKMGTYRWYSRIILSRRFIGRKKVVE